MEGGSGFPAPIMVDVRRRKLAIIAMLTVIGAYALYRYYSKYSHVLPNEDPDAHDVLGHDLHSTHLPHLHHTEGNADGVAAK